MAENRSATEPMPPSDWIRRFAHLVPAGGQVLDVAAGGGRHSRYFLDLGHPVVAVDIDIGKLADIGQRDGVEIIRADLEGDNAWPFPNRTFEAIVVTNYAHRPIFADLVASLAPGGVLIYESFGLGNERYGRPRSPDFLLRPGELWQAFAPELQIVAYEHGYEASPRQSIRQRIAAVAGAEPVPLTAP